MPPSARASPAREQPSGRRADARRRAGHARRASSAQQPLDEAGPPRASCASAARPGRSPPPRLAPRVLLGVQVVGDASARPAGGAGTSPSVRSTTSDLGLARAGPPRARRRAARPRPSSRTAGPGRCSATRATRYWRAAEAELLAHRLRPAPHLRDLHPPGARLAHHQLALDALVVEQRQRAAHGLRAPRRARTRAPRAGASASRARSRASR